MADGGRYAGMSHRELYDQLFAGKPSDVENTIAAWKSAERQADTLAGAVDRDLDRVIAGWEGTAGTEFRDRIGKISGYSRDLSGNFLATHSGLSQMSAALADAQSKAETPEEHDDNDKLVSGALDGAAKGAMLGPVGAAGGALIGGIFGHNQDEEEKERARERMAALVAGVAANYEMADTSDWRPFQPPPPGLPEGDPNLRSDPSSGPHVGRPSVDPGTGPGGSARTGTIDNPAHVSADPGITGGPATTGNGTVGNGTHVGTQLSGSGDGALAAGAMAVGAAGALTQIGGTPGPSGLGGTSLTSGNLPPGGVLGQTGSGTGAKPPTTGTNATTRTVNMTNGSGTSTASATGKGASPTKGAPGAGQSGQGPRGGSGNTSTANANGKSAAGRGGAKSGTGTAGSGREGGNRGGRPAIDGEGRNTTSSAARSQAAAGARSNGPEEDENDEHSTWLTEDDLVWRDADDVPPPVLGGV
ncbi:hypothetical protein DFJ67_2098 [Asanoa ferruginea]|uniref:WXG100 family type VII secretion target n=1 Tax=Asanoa ferruginea TaxID=53367 RepID=A0A3D9ZR33_9ACTN|nr:hypothetical protein [Asanoa ferruginea]REF96130.1 hypothetical protein DFJ67_2098 [Asanoa ferruginea]GIF49273.1 hypothetical protein Afe04nite_38120 [Asanoa ferruginea]